MRTMSIVSIQSIVVIQNYLKSEQMERGTHDLPFTKKIVQSLKKVFSTHLVENKENSEALAQQGVSEFFPFFSIKDGVIPGFATDFS